MSVSLAVGEAKGRGMDLRLSGRTVIVTGASSGVGLATVAQLKAEGAAVVGCARDLDRLRVAITELPGSGTVLPVQGDVTRPEDMQAVVERGVHAFGGIDGVVCNAGRSLMARIFDTSDDQLREELELKVFGVLHLVRAARPHLEASDAASVVAVNAILARQPEAHLAATSAARAALLNLVKTLSQELGPAGVRVNSVSLGLIDTGQWQRRHAASDSPLDYDAWSAKIARDRGIVLGRFGRAEEVAFPIVALLSPRSSYITGATVDVGGGVARYA